VSSATLKSTFTPSGALYTCFMNDTAYALAVAGGQLDPVPNSGLLNFTSVS
jgi:hypothetical protein